MKTAMITAFFLSVTLIIHWSCNEENIGNSNLDTAKSIHKKKGGNGNGGNGNGGPEVLYSAFYHGSVINSTSGSYRNTRDSKKYSILSNDCGGINLTGISALLFAHNGTSNCYQEPLFGEYREIRQFDKQKLPHRVAVHFAFSVPGTNQPQNKRLSMIGDVPLTNGEYTIFPANQGESITLTLEKWTLGGLGTDPCEEESEIFFADMGFADQMVTITHDGTGDCP